ncbi:MAG: DUF4276 family protein [Nitrospirae bacterium]|nr:DUF4276 family protein [Nitrospirota bacterium]
MKIALIVEGKTEKAFLPVLRKFLESQLEGRMPNIDPFPCKGRIHTETKLKRTVEDLLSGSRSADHVIALTDVYTGNKPPDFQDASEAKAKMRKWVGPNDRFHPHAAQYDFEAWLLPYWPTIQRLAGHNRQCPPGNPEMVNHDKSPAYHIIEIFRIGKFGKSYVKTRDALQILEKNDLAVAINRCKELKEFVNTISIRRTGCSMIVDRKIELTLRRHLMLSS